jgi:hypothetical protein
LALAVVAARAAMNPRSTLGDLAAALSAEQGRLDFLDTGDLATSVRAVFSWSYKQLSERSATVFRLLSLHPGASFTVPVAASAVCIPMADAQVALDDLVDENLLVREGSDRFHFHDLLRAYAVELVNLVESGPQRRQAQKRIFSHFLYSAQVARYLRSLNWFELRRRLQS